MTLRLLEKTYKTARIVETADPLDKGRYQELVLVSSHTLHA